MFSLLISSNGTAWETDQLMRMNADRFKEMSGSEADAVRLDKQDTLKSLERVPALLMYELGTESQSADIVRYGHLRDIKFRANELLFLFEEVGRIPRSVVQEFADRLGIARFEQNRTHWAVKDGNIPKGILDRLQPSYDVVFSFAGEDRKYVELVADYLRSEGIKVFYDQYEQANLWGKDLTEHLDAVYRHSGQYCVLFISKHYVEKMWPRHERRSALARALQERREYVPPARFDETQVQGIPPTIAYIDLSDISPVEFAKLILAKLGKASYRSEKN